VSRRSTGHLFNPVSDLSQISVPLETSHAGLSRGERLRAGISDGLIRLSVGIEDPDELSEDLGQALRLTS
jgi:cystathionine beta-lyase/cystathionine gamma-synthase